MGRKGSSKFNWTDESEDKLIAMWEANEFLYNMEMKDYANIDKKRRVLEEFAAEIGATGRSCHPAVTIVSCPEFHTTSTEFYFFMMIGMLPTYH